MTDTISNFELGQQFEKFVAHTIYPKNQYTLISTSPLHLDRHIQDNLSPDLKLKRINATHEFWVECKYRSNTRIDAITFDAKQIKRYLELKETVTYVIGLGGSPSAPLIIFSIPVVEMFTTMEIWKLERYIINTPLKIKKDSGQWSLVGIEK